MTNKPPPVNVDALIEALKIEIDKKEKESGCITNCDFIFNGYDLMAYKIALAALEESQGGACDGAT